MTTPEQQALRAEIARLGPWHHDVEVAPGVRTGDPVPRADGSETRPVPMLRPREHLHTIIQAVYPHGLQGRSFLDCACNGGGYAFAAAEAGAGTILGFDVREHWIAQAEFLARHLPSHDLTFSVLDLYDLPGLGAGQYDVTLFKGLFYHLPDPVTGLRIAAEHTRELLILNSATRPAKGEALVLSHESDTEVMSGVHRLAWFPTGPSVLQSILEWCGFPHSVVLFNQVPAPYGPPDGGRVEILAARDAQALAAVTGLDPGHAPGARSRIKRMLKRVAR